MADKFVRFVTHETDEVTGERIGFFKAAYALRRSGKLSAAEHETLSEHLDWFGDELDVPGRFHRSSNPNAHGKGLSWYKPGALEHLRRSRAILVERNGVMSEMLTTLRPGYLLYEDDHQICAIPFADEN